MTTILRIRQVAERLGYRPSTLRAMLQANVRGELRREQAMAVPPMRKGGIYGGHWGIAAHNLERWLQKGAK